MRLTRPQKLIYDMERFSGGSISVICGSMISEGERDVADLIHAAKKVYEINDALRIRIREVNGEVHQEVTEYQNRTINVLRFGSKAELDAYAQEYAQVPLDLYGCLCELSVILLPGHYGFLAKTHHIISDAWTLSLIGTQLNTLLHGEIPVAYSYCEYVANESEYLQSKRYENDRIYFLDQFKKCDEVTYLSEKHTSSLSAVRKTFVMDAAKAQRIKDYATQSKSSAYALFMTILAVYVNRVTMNTENFYIGTAVLNRSGVREKKTMGMFVNTVPMLMELENEKSFAHNLSKVGKTIFNAFRHQKYNYGEILSSLRSEFGFGEKLYDVMLSYQNAAIAGAPEDMETTWYHSGMQSESLQIHIDDRDSDGIFRIHYDYLTDRFTEHEIEMLHRHLETLLFDAIANDTENIYELDILTAEERQKLLCDFNNTAMEYPKDKCIHQLFEEQAARTPDKIAVVACDTTLTYKELNEEANRIANSLIDRGIGRGDVVAVILPRDSHLISALFGVLKSGAAYMPLDPSYPKERVDYLISESGSTAVIDETNIQTYISHTCIENPCISVAPSDLFCALHTSGSTGRPKVAALTQLNLVAFLYSNANFWKDVDTVISVTIATFDVFMMDTLLSAAQGLKIVLASNEQIYNQIEFEKLFEAEENVMFFATPTKLMSYVNQSQTADFLKKIRTLIVGGEVFPDELYDLLVKKIGTETLRNGYGPAETTIGSTYTEPIPPPPRNTNECSIMGLSQISMGRQKQQYGSHKKSVIYNGYGPTETTLGVAFCDVISYL